jgi:chromosomal replication initiator protein
MSGAISGWPAPADRLFDCFVPDSASAAALAAALSLARRESHGPRLLMLSGPPGVGKTHLLAAILGFTRRQHPSVAAVATTGAELVADMVRAFRDGRAPSVGTYADGDLLVADDLQVLAGKVVTQAEVGRLLKAVVARGGRVACGISGTLTQMPVLAGAGRALGSARLIEMGRPKRTALRRILAIRAAAAGMRISAATLTCLANLGRGDVRRALGALNRLQFENSLRAGGSDAWAG